MLFYNVSQDVPRSICHGNRKVVSNMANTKTHLTFSQRVLHWVYTYRTWWLDFPTISLLGMYHWHFYSRGIHPVPRELVQFCWYALGAYWLIKEGVRWHLKGIISRRGSIFVALWVASLLEFSIVLQVWPDGYIMPSDMLRTTLIVLLGFLGILPVKRVFAKKYPNFIASLQVNDEL
jgi:hypothetical protein